MSTESVRITIGGVSTPYRQGFMFHLKEPIDKSVLFTVCRDFHIMPEHAVHCRQVFDTLIRLGVVMPVTAGTAGIDFERGKAFDASTQQIQMQAMCANKE